MFPIAWLIVTCRNDVDDATSRYSGQSHKIFPNLEQARIAWYARLPAPSPGTGAPHILHDSERVQQSRSSRSDGPPAPRRPDQPHTSSTAPTSKHRPQHNAELTHPPRNDAPTASTTERGGHRVHHGAHPYPQAAPGAHAPSGMRAESHTPTTPTRLERGPSKASRDAFFGMASSPSTGVRSPSSSARAPSLSVSTSSVHDTTRTSATTARDTPSSMSADQPEQPTPSASTILQNDAESHRYRIPTDLNSAYEGARHTPLTWVVVRGRRAGVYTDA